MNSDLLWVLLLLVSCMALFVANKPRMDVVAILVITILPLSGLVTLPQALAGFSDPNLVLIAALFVIGDGLVRTGITYQVGDWLVKKSGSSETRMLVLLMLSVSSLGAFMSSTGVVAVFIPVVLSVANRLRIPPGRLMMPLSFAGLISGMLTLVATPPNMVADSALKQAGFSGLPFFSFTPVGALILVMGIAYMLVARKWLGQNHNHDAGKTSRRGLAHLISDYRLEKRGLRLRVLETSPMVGKQLSSLNLRRTLGINIIAIERRGKFRHELHHPHAHTELHAGDILLADLFDPAANVEKLRSEMHLEMMPLRGVYFMDRSREVGMVEVAIPAESALIGKTILKFAFRSKQGLSVVGLRRGGSAFEGSLLDEKLKMGDILLVAGPWKAIRLLQTQRHDFMVLSLPAEIDEVAPALSQAPYAVISLLAMVGLMVSGIVPNVLAALIACLLMGAFRCIDMDSAYKAIHWQSLVLIVGMMPFAHSLQSTGGIELAVNALMELLGGSGPRMLLGSLFVLTAITGLFISNTATAVLMSPMALTLAAHLDASPVPFVMTVAIAASAAFMTPISSPVNTLVLGPGQYRFGDFVKVGVPFTFLVLLTTVVLIPWLFPL